MTTKYIMAHVFEQQSVNIGVSPKLVPDDLNVMVCDLNHCVHSVTKNSEMER